MPQPSSPAITVPPCLSPDSAKAWARLCNYLRHTERRLLLVIRHNSPRLPRELPPLLAAEFQRPLITAQVTDDLPDPMAAAMLAAPGGDFPSGCILSISGAEDLDITAADNSRVALHEFARRLDLRRDQFVPNGGIVLVWATARVFDALAEHSLNFISRAASIVDLNAADTQAPLQTQVQPSVGRAASYRLPPLPADAPADLVAALNAFEDLAVANELYLGGKTAQALAHFDAARDRIEQGWADAVRYADLESDNLPTSSPFRNCARVFVAAYPSAGIHLIDLRFPPRQLIAWLETQARAARLTLDRAAESQALGNLGLAHAGLGDVRKAIVFYEQHRNIAREIGSRRGEGNALMNLGNAHAILGDARKAIECYEQALIIDRETGDQRGESASLGNLGNAHVDLGNLHKAIEFFEQQLVITREVGDRRGEGNALGGLGNAYKNLGDVQKAIEFYKLKLVIARELGDRRGEGVALGSLGNAQYSMGDVRNSIEFHEQALVVFREIGDRRGEGGALWNAALSFKKLGERSEALSRARAALAIYEAIEDPNSAKVRTATAKWEAEG